MRDSYELQKFCEANGYGHNLGLLIVLNWLRVHIVQEVSVELKVSK